MTSTRNGHRMSHPSLRSAFAVLATATVVAGLALTSLPAPASAWTHPTAVSPGAVRPDATGKPLSRTQLLHIRARQQQMAADSHTPTFAKAGSKTFRVDTTEDSPLAHPAGTTCVDASTGKCSLRSAVVAANNLHAAVQILLGRHTYTLTAASTLAVIDSRGISILGRGAGKTTIEGDGSGIFDVGSPSRPGALYLTSLKLRNGTATQGGAAHLEPSSGANLTLDHVTARHNSASDGGVIYAASDAGVYISHSTFSHNHADAGGVIDQTWADVRISDSSFTANSSAAGTIGRGGAIYNERGVVDVTGSSFSGNTVGDATHAGFGGAIFDSGSTTTLTDVHLDGNTAEGSGQGGAIFTEVDSLEINHGTISHNHASGSAGSGGGIYSSQQSQVALHGVTMAGNRAGGNSAGHGGGAIYSYGSLFPSQLVIDGGSTITGSTNAAVYLYTLGGGLDASITDSSLAQNTDHSNNGWGGFGCGGAVCVDASFQGAVNLELQRDHLTANSSTGLLESGAVEVWASQYSPVSLVMRHTIFAKNHAHASGLGGAVGLSSDLVNSPISVRMSSNDFVGNSAGSHLQAGRGGALYEHNDVTVTDHGSTFEKNRAVGDGAYGGAVCDVGFQQSSYAHSTFTDNSAGTAHGGNGYEGFGGAYYSEDSQGGNTFTQVTMAGNKAAYRGGAFYGDSDNHQTSFRSSTLSGNTAGTSSRVGEGGGIFTFGAVLTVENSTLTGNRALSVPGDPGEGGAIWQAGQRLGLRYSTVSGNAAKTGGGIYSAARGGSILSSIVSRNRTSASGSESDCAVMTRLSKPGSLGGNVLGQGSCVTGLQTGDTVSKKPHLGKLKNNGGPTRTMAISAASPAVGRAIYLVPTVDQRGQGRPAKHADAGAYERPQVKHHRHP
jgi:hypothetical protein